MNNVYCRLFNVLLYMTLRRIFRCGLVFSRYSRQTFDLASLALLDEDTQQRGPVSGTNGYLNWTSDSNVGPLSGPRPFPNHHPIMGNDADDLGGSPQP